MKLTAKRLKLVQTGVGRRDEKAAPVIKKLHKAGKIEADAISGFFGSE